MNHTVGLIDCINKKWHDKITIFELKQLFIHSGHSKLFFKIKFNQDFLIKILENIEFKEWIEECLLVEIKYDTNRNSILTMINDALAKTSNVNVYTVYCEIAVKSKPFFSQLCPSRQNILPNIAFIDGVLPLHPDKDFILKATKQINQKLLSIDSSKELTEYCQAGFKLSSKLQKSFEKDSSFPDKAFANLCPIKDELFASFNFFKFIGTNLTVDRCNTPGHFKEIYDAILKRFSAGENLACYVYILNGALKTGNDQILERLIPSPVILNNTLKKDLFQWVLYDSEKRLDNLDENKNFLQLINIYLVNFDYGYQFNHQIEYLDCCKKGFTESNELFELLCPAIPEKSENICYWFIEKVIPDTRKFQHAVVLGQSIFKELTEPNRNKYDTLELFFDALAKSNATSDLFEKVLPSIKFSVFRIPSFCKIFLENLKPENRHMQKLMHGIIKEIENEVKIEAYIYLCESAHELQDKSIFEKLSPIGNKNLIRALSQDIIPGFLKFSFMAWILNLPKRKNM